MSKYKDKCKAFKDEEIAESFNEAIKNGEVTDLMGEKMSEDDFMTLDPKQIVPSIVTILTNSTKHLEGKLLTIIDATYEDKKAKYVKDLVKSAVRDTLNDNVTVIQETFGD